MAGNLMATSAYPCIYVRKGDQELELLALYQLGNFFKVFTSLKCF